MDNQYTGQATAHPAGFSERERTIERLDRLATLLDTAYRVPGTNVRFGLDALIGLFPGLGDVASAALSAYLIYEARRLGVRRSAIARMIGNVALDMVVGALPLVGDAADVFWRANARNMRISVRTSEGGIAGRPRRLAAAGRFVPPDQLGSARLRRKRQYARAWSVT